MNILNFEKSTSGSFVAGKTLDELWSQAAAIGAVHLEPEFLNHATHRVRIHFKRATGTMVWAEGKDTDIRQAFLLAIAEANTLGAV